MKTTFIIITVVVISATGCSDEAKLQHLTGLCKNQASEHIFTVASSSRVGFHDQPYGEPAGRAKLFVLDWRYDPSHLINKLLEDPYPLKEVRYNYDVPPSAAIAGCVGTFTNLASREKPSLLGGDCSDAKPAFDDPSIEYTVAYEYGTVDRYDVRSFTFKIVDRKGHTLAEQKSFQLLLGSMNNRDTRILYGWGSSQGTKTCGLTPPDTFIKQVLTGAPRSAQQ